MLENETFTAQIGDEKVRLLPIDMTKDIPDPWKSMTKLLDLMKDRRDWDKLPAVLEGMHIAKRKFKPYQWEKLMRKASDAGMQQVIVECARRAKTTNLPLHEPSVVRVIMWSMRKEAVQNQWQPGWTTRALNHAEQILLCLDQLEHRPKHNVENLHPRRQPDIIGVVLELAAMRASKHTDGEDKDGKVAHYAELLLTTTAGQISVLGDEQDWRRADDELQKWVPLRQGLKVAMQVLGDNMPYAAKAKSMLTQLDESIASASAAVIAGAVNERPAGLNMLHESLVREQT